MVDTSRHLKTRLATRGHFQMFNFPFEVDGDVNESYLDYGSSADLNLDVDNAGNLIFQAKLPYRIDKPRWSVRAKQPCIPCLPPNQRALIPDEPIEYSRRKASVPVKHSLSVYSDFPEVMFGSCVELIHKELDGDDDLWNCCPRLSVESTSLSDFFDHECIMCSFKVQNYVEPHSCMKMRRKYWLENLSSTIADIPPDLVEGLLRESYEEKLEQCKYDTTQGNVLACSGAGSGNDGVVVYPGGPLLEVLNVSRFTCTADEGLDLELKQQFAINGSIKQVVCASVVPGQLLAAARSQYHVTFFQGSLQTQAKLKPLESVACTSQTTSAALSPYIPNEGVVALEDGSLHLWSHGHALQMLHEPDEMPKKHKLNECVYASNPRCAILANTTEAEVIDFRAGSRSQTTLFSIPSPHVHSFEVLSALQRQQQNPHHTFIATDLSILLLDDRFSQHPVLKWHHHLQDVPQFMEIICDTPPDENLLMISGSHHRETHCYQFSDQDGTLPPMSTSLPWKLSPYNDWLSNLDNRPGFPAVNDRVTRPLIGICAVPHPATKGFTVLTMSSLGDLFQQPFVVDELGEEGTDKTCSVGCGSRRVQLNSQITGTCAEWISAVREEADELKLGEPFSKNFFQFDKGPIFEKMISVEQPHPVCSLCSRSCDDDDDGDVREGSICPRCGVDVHASHKLLELQHCNGIITNKRLSAQEDFDELFSFEQTLEAGTHDPLGRNMIRNWENDDPMPLDLPGEENDGDRNDGVMAGLAEA